MGSPLLSGKFLLLSSNKGYELDAFLEAFASCSDKGIKTRLMGIVKEGRALIVIIGAPNIDLNVIADAINSERRSLKFVRKVRGYSMLCKRVELGPFLTKVNSDLRQMAPTTKVAVVVDGTEITDSLKEELIQRTLSGTNVVVDLDEPDISIEFFFFWDYFLASTGPSYL